MSIHVRAVLMWPLSFSGSLPIDWYFADASIPKNVPIPMPIIDRLMGTRWNTPSVSIPRSKNAVILAIMVVTFQFCRLSESSCSAHKIFPYDN